MLSYLLYAPLLLYESRRGSYHHHPTTNHYYSTTTNVIYGCSGQLIAILHVLFSDLLLFLLVAVVYFVV